MTSYNNKYKNKNVLVTGASGFVGSQLVRTLCACGANVSVMTRSVSYKNEYISCYVGDIKDGEFVSSCVTQANPAYIFHLAAHKDRSPNIEVFPLSLEVNLLGTLNLFLSASKLHKLESIVIAGTADEYGLCETPYKEDFKELPSTAYAYSKNCVTQLSNLFATNYGLPSVVLRPTVIYGPGQDVEMFIPALIKSIIKNKSFSMTLGKQTRDFIYIDDLIRGFMMAALNKSTHGEVLNIGSGVSVQISKVAMFVEEMLGKNGLVQIGALDYRPGEKMKYCVDINKIKKTLNWMPEMDFKIGLQNTIDYYNHSK